MEYKIIKKQYGRISAIFTVFEWKNRKQAYIECKISRKVPKHRGGFEMKEFTFNGNSLHSEGYKKDFNNIPNYESMAKRWNTSAFLYIYKDFGIMPLENYKQFYL